MSRCVLYQWTHWLVIFSTSARGARLEDYGIESRDVLALTVNGPALARR